MKWDYRYIVKSFQCVTFSLLLLIKQFFNLFLPRPLLLLWFHHGLWRKTLIVEFLCFSVSLVASLVGQDNANKIKEKSTFQCDMTWAKWNPEIHVQGHSMGHTNLVVVTINNLSFCIPVLPWLHLHNMHCKNEHTPYVFLKYYETCFSLAFPYRCYPGFALNASICYQGPVIWNINILPPVGGGE